ncbi:DNA helicase [Tanacetum coccineum]
MLPYLLGKPLVRMTRDVEYVANNNIAPQSLNGTGQCIPLNTCEDVVGQQIVGSGVSGSSRKCSDGMGNLTKDAYNVLAQQITDSDVGGSKPKGSRHLQNLNKGSHNAVAEQPFPFHIHGSKRKHSDVLRNFNEDDIHISDQLMVGEDAGGSKRIRVCQAADVELLQGNVQQLKCPLGVNEVPSDINVDIPDVQTCLGTQQRVSNNSDDVSDSASQNSVPLSNPQAPQAPQEFTRSIPQTDNQNTSSPLPSNYKSVGRCEHSCEYCGALFWYDERLKSIGTNRRPKYGRCCKGGQVVLRTYQIYPDYIKLLLNDRHFMENIRAYNQMFSMTSLGAHIDESVNNGRGPYVFKISGQLYHWLGSLCPTEGEPPRFLQLYIYDTDNEVDNRMSHFGGQNSDLRRDIVEGLIALVHLFRTAREKLADTHIPNFKVRLYNVVGAREYELPTGDMLGAIVYEPGPETDMDYDIIIEERSGHPQHVNKLHSSYMSLQFPLLVPYGENGYSKDMKLAGGTGTSTSRKRLTMLAYYTYFIHDRLNSYNYLSRTGRLFQQYIVTAFCAIEQNRIDYIREHQNDIRNEYLSGIYDAINRGDNDGSDCGARLILPQSFTGGPRYMYSHYLDALAICRVHGNPYFFITFTCNVKWPEITDYMAEFPLLTTTDRADIVDRVFEMKIQQFIKYLRDAKPFGRVVAEYCGWTMLIKYLFKYISKGTDRIVARISRNQTTTHESTNRPRVVVDEIKNYLDSRYISLHEACWRMLEFNIHHREPAVQILSIHLQNMQRVVFRDNDRLDTVVTNAHSKKTTLTEWLYYNEWNTDGRHLTYLDFPSEFVWNPNGKYWSRRRQKHKSSIGRLTYVRDLFYQRILLCHQKGCKSFPEIRKVNDIVYPTCRAACQALGLLEDDQEWENTMKEVARTATPAELRMLFAHILTFCQVSYPSTLWQRVCKAIFEGVQDDSQLEDYVLYELEGCLNHCSRSLTDFGLRLPPEDLMSVLTNRLLMEEKGYNREFLVKEKEKLMEKLNEKQRHIFDKIITVCRNNQQELIFVYGHGGTGKTFLWKTITYTLRAEGKIVLAVASSGVASLLLPAGRTAHSRFKLPLDLTDTSVCSIKKNTQLAKLIKETSLIIWDEAPMNDRRCFETLDRTLQDILSMPNVLFGGSSIAESYLWQHFNLYRLTENMRLKNGSLNETDKQRVAAFAQWLLDIGDGHLGTPDELDPESTSWVDIPDNYRIPDDENRFLKLIRFIYDDQTLRNPTPQQLQEKVIVCPKNEVVDIVNTKVMSMIPGTPTVYTSYDEALPHVTYTDTMDTWRMMRRTMEITRNMNLSREDKGKMVAAEPEITPVADLTPTDSNKIIEVFVYHKWVSKHNQTRQPRNFCCILLDKQGTPIQANMDVVDTEYFNELLQLRATYRISGFGCEKTPSWERTLRNNTSLIFGKYVQAHNIPNDNFPQHYFDFAAYNELEDRANVRDAVLTDYIGRIRAVSGIYTFGDATSQRKKRRIIDIENLSGNIIGLALWNEMAMQFDMQIYDSLPKPVVIAVSSCWVARYNGLQLSATSATHYYLNPNIPETLHINQQSEQSTDTTPFLIINNQRYEDPNLERTRNRFPLATLLKINPQNYQPQYLESTRKKNGTTKDAPPAAKR